MNSIVIASITLGCAFGGVLLGAFLRRRLPEHHLREDSKDVVKLGAGVIATLTALVLGLLITSAKSSYDAVGEGLAQCGTDAIMLDRVLAQYGTPEANEARRSLRGTLGAMIVRLWPEEKSKVEAPDSTEVITGLTALHNSLLKLVPQNDAQRSLLAQAMETVVDLRQSRLKIMERGEMSMPILFLIVLIFWLMVLFASFGLLAPANPTNVTVLFLCALSVAGAIFLLVEMSHPTSGLMKVSSGPLMKAFSILSR
jgi:hypothetical protein